MSPAFLAVIISIVLLVILTVLPLIPAILIYTLFPKTAVVANGPLSGLTLKSSGAFSIYVIVFLVLAPFAYRTYNTVSALASPSWTIVGKIKLKDSSSGADVPAATSTRPVQVSLSPSLLQIDGDQFRVKVPEFDGRVPVLTFSLGDLGSQVVNLDDPGDNAIDVDDEKKVIKVLTPVTIRLSSTSYSATGTLEPAAKTLPVAGQPK